MSAAGGKAYARAALLGNPSDGYGGKTIAFTLRELAAEVVVEEGSGALEPPAASALLAATLRRFRRDREDRGVPIPGRPVSMRCETTIPKEVGLGGSSAIVIAALRALGDLYSVPIEPEDLATLALAVETEELGIHAGPQDRVAQAFQGLVYMDFDPEIVAERGHGLYEPLDPNLLPPLLIAYRVDAAEPSSAPHRDLRSRIEGGDRDACDAIAEIAELARAGREVLEARDLAGLRRLLDRNFELRRRLHSLDPRHERMVELSVSLGMPANYAGSGGAIVAVLGEDGHLGHARAAFEAEGCAALIPTIG